MLALEVVEVLLCVELTNQFSSERGRTKHMKSYQKAIVTTCLILSAIMILDSMNAGYAIVMFLLAGVIPGTNVAISGAHMLELFVLLIGIVLSRITLRVMRSSELFA